MEENTTETPETIEVPASDNEILVIASKIKTYVKELDPSMRVAGDFAEGLTDEVKHIIQRAVGRARKNNRGTVQARDV
jgi:histone H3/H4